MCRRCGLIETRFRITRFFFGFFWRAAITFFCKTVNSLAAEPLLNSIEKKRTGKFKKKLFYLILLGLMTSIWFFYFQNLGCNVQVHLDNKEKRETVMMKAWGPVVELWCHPAIRFHSIWLLLYTGGPAPGWVFVLWALLFLFYPRKTVSPNNHLTVLPAEAIRQ